MAGVTDLAYRLLCREHDPDVLLATEMISSKSLIYSKANNHRHEHSSRMQIPNFDPLTGIQIFGHEPEVMAQAAQIAEKAGAKFIDINMGCPVPKIVKGNDGAALMKDPELAANIVKNIIASVSIPVTVKMRLGWCSESLNAVTLAKTFEDLGLKALTIHGRTRAQKYSGKADWFKIREVVEAVSIPVFANGDVKNIHDAKQILEISKASGLAIARATMGKPWLSKQINHYLKFSEILPEPNINERLELALKHSKLLVEFKGEEIGIKESRKHLGHYLSGIQGVSKFRETMPSIRTLAALTEALEYLRDSCMTESCQREDLESQAEHLDQVYYH